MESSCKFNLSILHVWFKTFGLNHPVCSICKYLMSGSTLLDGITLYIQLISSSCLFQNFWMDGITLYVQIVCSSCLVQNFGWKHPVCSTCLLHAWFNIFRLNHPVCLICQYFMSGSKLLDGITLYVQFVSTSCLVQNVRMESPCMFKLVSTSCVVQNFWMESPCIFNLSVLHVWFKTFGWNHPVYSTCLFFMSGSKFGWNHPVQIPPSVSTIKHSGRTESFVGLYTDKCPTKLSDKCPTKLSDKCPTKSSQVGVRVSTLR
jgi:hypothetical protein